VLVSLEGENDMRSYVMLVVFGCTIGCVAKRVTGPRAVVPSDGCPARIIYVGMSSIPASLSNADRQQIENIVGRIRELGDPVYINQVFSPAGSTNTWVYRSNAYDVYVSQSQQGRWEFIRVKDAPTW